MNLAALEQQFGLPPGLLPAVMQAESGGDPNAVSPKGAVGAFQFMPATANEYGIDPRDPEQAAPAAAKMLSTLLAKYKGDVPSTLAAYNWGQGNVDKFGLDKAPPETKGYIDKVTSGMIDPSQVQWDAPDPSKVQWDQKPIPMKNADAALGGTLQLGVPFTGLRYDTGIKLPTSVEAGLVDMGKTGARLIQGVRQILPGSNAALDQQVADDNAAVAPLEKEHPVATTIGGALPYFVTGNPLALAGLSAAEYGTPTERLTRGALSYGGAKLGQGVARVLGGPESMAGVPNAATDFADYAASTGNKWGIPTTVGMNGNKTAQLAESVIANMPFVNGAVNDARNAAFQGFNRAVTNTFGEDSSQITPDLLGLARRRIGNTIGDISSRNSIAVDQPLFGALQDAAKRAATELAPDDAKIATTQIQNIWNAVDPQTGTIPGTMYKALQSKMGEIGKANGGTVSSIMNDTRAAMRDAMTRSVSPNDASAWLNANRQYFNVNQVANAAKQTPGTLSPTRLLQQVNSAQTAAKFGGGNDLAELAQWAKPTLTDQIPNSGTAQRAFMQRLLTNPLTGLAELGGLGYVANETDSPMLAGSLGLLAPLLVGRSLARAPTSELTQRLLRSAGGGLLALPAP